MDSQSVPTSSSGAHQLAPGATLGGRYEILEAAGNAAFGTLYKAKRRVDAQLVTVEVLDPVLFGDARLRAAVRKEIEQLQGLEHKNLAVPIDFGDELVRTGQLTYVVLEHLDGQSLADMNEKKRQQGKPFSMRGAYNVVAHLANGLQALHDHGALHGGLSSRSVHVTSAGRVKVIELGLARALLSLGGKAVVAQAVPNLAPEALGAPDRVDRRVDVFGTGALMYELITGQVPSVPAQMASSIDPQLPRTLDVFLDTCLRMEAPSRYPDMGRLKEALQGAVGPEIAPAGAPGTQTASHKAIEPAVLTSAPTPVAARPGPPPPRVGPPPPRNPGLPPSSSNPSVPRSFNVDSALSDVDETQERWLVQKDKLDFGPFTLRDVKAQIESGKIMGEHTLVDTETGERRRVKDHPALRELVMSSEIIHAENERLRLEAASRDKHRNRIVVLLGAFVVVAGGAGAGIFVWVKNHQPTIIREKVQVPGEPDLKFEIAMKVDPPEKHTGKRKGGGGKSGAGGKNGAFDDTQVLGDASEGGGDETLDQGTVQKVMSQNFKVLVGCIQEERHRNAGLHQVDLDFIIKGSGSVQAVRVNGQTSGPFANCMYGKMQTVSFPKFNGSKTHASFSLSMK